MIKVILAVVFVVGVIFFSERAEDNYEKLHSSKQGLTLFFKEASKLKKKVGITLIIVMALFVFGVFSYAESVQTTRIINGIEYDCSKNEVVDQLGDPTEAYEDKQQIIKELTKKYNHSENSQEYSSMLAYNYSSDELLEDLTTKDSVEILKYVVKDSEVLTCIFGDGRLIYAYLGEDILFGQHNIRFKKGCDISASHPF